MQTSIVALSLLLAGTLLVNIPLGMARESVPRFSWRWFVYIHISIPFIVAARLLLGFNWMFIPFTLISAVAGQLIGGRFQRGRQA